MSINIKPAPLPVDDEVVARQVSLQLSTSSALIKPDALEALIERKAIHLSPHPEVTIGDPVDWHMNPLGERNWSAQLHMFRWIRPLVTEAKERGNSDAAELIAKYIRSWAESAFPLEGSPRYAWSDMIDAVRTLEFLDAYTVVPEDDRDFIGALLYVHGEWLADPKNLGHSNHAVWQHIALFVLGHVFDKKDWIATSKERISHAFDFEYDDEGINREAAPGYHLYNYILWHDVNDRMIAEGDGIKDLASKLDMARSALIQFTWPDGNLIELGDTGPRSHLKKLAGSEDIQYVLTKGAEGKIPAEIFSTYKAGYAFGRSGWGANTKDYQDEFFWSLRYGRIGVHGHNDIGSFYLGASGQRLLIDAGKYGYISDDNKRHIIGRSAHNTLVVNDAETKEDVDYQVLNKHHTSAFDDIEVQGFPYQGVRHTRRVIYVRGADAVIVLDGATSKKEHDYHLYWHLDPKAAVTHKGRTSHVKVGRARFAVSEIGTRSNSELVKGISSPKMEGWHSPKWGEMEPTPTIKMTKFGSRLRFITVIASDDRQKFHAESVTAGSNQFILTTAHGYYTVDASTSPATVAFSRGEKPKHVSASRIEDQALAQVSNEIDLKAKNFESDLGRALRERLEIYTSQHSKIGDSVRRGIELCQETDSLDHGLRAAVIDAVGCGLGVKHEFISKLKDSDSRFRDPIDLSSISERSDDTGFFETKSRSGGLFNGIAINGTHVLPWSGRRGSNTLIVRFNGAIDRSKVSLPYFGGLSSLLGRKESLLVFSDPAFDTNTELNLGWYLGELPDGSLIFDWINQIIDGYVDKWGIEKVVLFGSSGGGFASLQVGLRRDGARIVPMNPQTVLSNYFEPFYLRGRDSAFPNGEVAELKYPAAFDTRLLLSDKSKHSIVHYVDNSAGDKHHHRHHYLPFAAAAKEQGFEFKHIGVDLGNGHKPVGSDLVDQFLDGVIED